MFHTMRSTMWAVLSVSGLWLASTWAFVINRKITMKLDVPSVTLNSPAKKVVDGEISPMPGAHEAPMDSVLSALGRMEQDLARMVTQVRNSSASIADMSQRTEARASSLQEALAWTAPLTTGNVRCNTDTARDAGRSIADIAKQVNDVAWMIRKITDSAMTQTAGIGQAQVAISDLDEVAQQNAALLRQSAASVESLRQQALNLQRLMSHFRI
jgi:methyl-accepting chemotaxis protein